MLFGDRVKKDQALGHVARMKDIRNAYRTLTRKLEKIWA
jgi:hypothetical protein